MIRARKVVARLLGESIDPALAAVCTRRLQQLGRFERARLLRHTENLAELHSYLREYVFRNDTDTAAFIQQCLRELHQAAPALA
jgi:hypothetical protein